MATPQNTLGTNRTLGIRAGHVAGRVVRPCRNGIVGLPSVFVTPTRQTKHARKVSSVSRPYVRKFAECPGVPLGKLGGEILPPSRQRFPPSISKLCRVSKVVLGV